MHRAEVVEVGQEQFSDALGEVLGFGMVTVILQANVVKVIGDGPDGSAPIGIGNNDIRVVVGAVLFGEASCAPRGEKVIFLQKVALDHERGLFLIWEASP